MEQPGTVGKRISSVTRRWLVPVAPRGLLGQGLGVQDHTNTSKKYLNNFKYCISAGKAAILDKNHVQVKKLLNPSQSCGNKYCRDRGLNRSSDAKEFSS